MAGSLHRAGRSWLLQGCGPGCFLWQAHNPAWPEEVAMEEEKLQAGRGEYLGLQQRGKQDTTTLVTFTVMLWYTPQFAASFTDMEDDMEVFFELLVEETNQGYINSEIPVRIKRLGARQHPSITEDPVMHYGDILDSFTASMPSHELLNCADVAVILVNNTNPPM